MVLQTLKGYRVLCGLKQGEMAEKVGISKSNYCQKENCKAVFSMAEMFKITDIVREKFPKVSMEALFSCPSISQNEISKRQKEQRSDV